MRAHLEQVKKQTGKTPAELDVEPLPVELAHVWRAFADLMRSAGDSPIAYAEILAYSTLTAQDFPVREIKAIKALEALYWTERKAWQT